MTEKTRNRMYHVHAKAFSREAGVPVSRILSVHFYLRDGKIVFRAVDAFRNRSEPIGPNSRARLSDVYLAAIALAYKLRYLRARDFESSRRAEPAGVINGRTIAHIVDRSNGIIVDRVTIKKEDLPEIRARFLNPYDLDRILTGVIEVDREEDYVELADEDKRELLLQAQKVVKAAEPVKVSKGKHTYAFTPEELSFAPNFAWAVWALENAEVGDEDGLWSRVSSESDCRQGTCSVTWQDAKYKDAGPTSPGFRQCYCPKGRFAF